MKKKKKKCIDCGLCISIINNDNDLENNKYKNKKLDEDIINKLLDLCPAEAIEIMEKKNEKNRFN